MDFSVLHGYHFNFYLRTIHNMKIDKNRIQLLLEKYRDNQCSREEFEELILLAQDPAYDKIIKDISKLDWDQNQSQSPEITSPDLPGKFNLSVFFKVAAAIVILLLCGIGMIRWFSVSDPIIYSTGNGEVKEIALPDGSRVTLNANSTLSWIPTRSRNDSRLVQLSGEGFFEVVKEVEFSSGSTDYRGFQVVTPKMTIHVLGTSFNVSARSENTEVFLQQGSVELQIPEEGEDVQRMVPGEKIVVNNETGQLTKMESEDLSTSASWVTGILNYRDKTLAEVLKNLSEIFGVEIILRDTNLQDKKINLGVPYMDWENTKRALEMAIGVEFHQKGKAYFILQKEQDDTQ